MGGLDLPVIVLGGGGHARVLLDTLELLSVKVLGVTDAFPRMVDRSKLKVEFLGTDEVFSKPDYGPEKVYLVNGIGSIGDTTKRTKLFNDFEKRGYRFASAIHPSVVLAKDVRLSEGVQIMAGVVIQTGCRIGRNVVINTRASIDHDCVIEDHVFIAPGVVLSGNVTVLEGGHIGTLGGSIQGMTIGKGSLVGAGYVVTENVPDFIARKKKLGASAQDRTE